MVFNYNGHSWAGWHLPIFLVLQEAEAGGWTQVQGWSGLQGNQTGPYSKINRSKHSECFKAGHFDDSHVTAKVVILFYLCKGETRLQ